MLEHFNSVDQMSPEIVPGMGAIIAGMKPVLDSTYHNNDLRGMRMIVKDFKEMFLNLKKKEQVQINNNFRANNLALWSDEK